MIVEERRRAFKVGEWTVQPELNLMTREGVERHIEPKVMKVLLTLASHQGRVVSKEELISAAWADTFVSDDVLTRCISILRRITEDDPHTPRFIQTIPKVGYRLVAQVVDLPDDSRKDAIYVSHIGVARSAVHKVGQNDDLYAVEPAVPDRRSRWRNLLIGVSLALIVLVAVASFWSYQRARVWLVKSNPPFKTIQFTSYAGEQTQPVFSPDGKSIAFVWISEDSRSRRIYVKTIGSEEVRQLSFGEEEQFSPAWSPDGRQIAYLAIGKDSLNLNVADIDSKIPPRRLLIPQEPSHWEQNALSWSPSGKSLIYPDHSGIQPNSSIFLLDLDTMHTRSITDPPSGWEGDLNPAYSPDGRWIAFTRASENAVRDIYFMSTSDGKVQQLTHDHMNIESLAWMSDSGSIVFSSNRGGKYALWKVALREKRAERLPVGTEDAYEPAVGPKAGQLAYSQGSAIWSIVRLREGVKRGTDAASKAVLTSTQQDSAPSLSPDGQFFAFQSRRSGNQEIWISSEQGDNLRQLTFMAGPLTGSPSWSNHGDRIVFDSRPGGHSHIFCVSTAGGPPKQLTFGNVNDITPRWSRDDQTIYFRSNRGDRWQLWKISALRGEPQPVTTGDGIVPQESPDGKWLYYTRGDEDGLWRVSPAGGAETQIMPQPAAGFWGYWQITSRGIFFLDQSPSSSSIRIFEPETKKISLFSTLKQTPPPYSGLTVAVDGRELLMTDQHAAGRHITFVEAQP